MKMGAVPRVICPVHRGGRSRHTWGLRKSAILFGFEVCWASDRAPLCRCGSWSSSMTALLGVDSVSKPHRSFLLASLLPAFLLASAFAVVQAQNAGSPAAHRWSDPATWPDRKVPAKDDVVTIAKDMNVILDVSPPPLHGLTLNGTLSFADTKDLELTTEWILVHGELEIGTEARPHTHRATIGVKLSLATRPSILAGESSVT